MKRTFLRILPLAVAVLLATSCSKDENNDNAVVNNGQENVQTKTMPISITVNQKGLSKLTCANGTGVDLQPLFEPGDELGIYMKDGDLLKTLTVAKENITNGGKTAVFEGELDADGLVDGVTELTAKIGTQIDAAITATSRENAVRQGCYQTADFVYSKTGNSVLLEEQNAYIEVVCTNKDNATIDFTIDSKSVPLTLNGNGQGWIVVPAEKSVICATLGITEARTTVKGNIYGITREFSAEPVYVDLGLTSGNLWAAENYSSNGNTTFTYAQAYALDGIPTKEDFVELYDQCLWVWDGTVGHEGYYVFKSKDAKDKRKVTPTATYDALTDTHIFLPVASSGGNIGIYWSSTHGNDAYGAYCLHFDSDDVKPEFSNYDGFDYSVRLVRHSN